MKTPKSILKEAKRVIQKHGWTQGELWKFRNGRYAGFCITGALLFCRDEASRETGREARGFIKRAIRSEKVVAWNDHPDRTHEEVVQAFNKAIELAS